MAYFRKPSSLIKISAIPIGACLLYTSRCVYETDPKQRDNLLALNVINDDSSSESADRIKKPSEVLKEGQKVKAKVLNTNDNKISLSMKALEEEMVDTEPAEDLEQYTSKESFGSSLGSLLAGIKLD